MRYDGYGQTLGTYAAGTLPTPWKYQGRLDVSPDSDNPLCDAGARFYSPAIGAFTQLDTVSGSAQDPWSMNRYLYAGANPTSMIDPDGHMFIQGPQADLGGNSYHVKPIQHNVPKGSSYEPRSAASSRASPARNSKPAELETYLREHADEIEAFAASGERYREI